MMTPEIKAAIKLATEKLGGPLESSAVAALAVLV